MDLVIPNYPLAWHPNLGNVASGYNSIVIASNGSGAGFPHNLAPYQASGTFAEFAKRNTDGGYGPLNDINGLAENIAPNNLSNALARFAAFMIDWGNTADGIQDQNPATGSHRLNIMDDFFTEIGISSKPGWSAGNVTEVQEFGRRISPHVALTGAVYRDLDSNGFFNPGEGVGGATISATPVGGGAARQTTSYGSGGYALELNTPGTYSVSVSSAFGVRNVGNVTLNTRNLLLNVVVTGVTTTDPKILSALNFITSSTLIGGCTPGTGRVVLSAPAPAGGIVVNLASTNPAATVPPTLTIPAGAVSATFPITTTPTVATQSGQITATRGQEKRSATLYVRSVRIRSLVLNPNSVKGGGAVTGTVTLECGAAPGGIIVKLMSSNTAVAKLAVSQLRIAAGATSRSFSVATSPVSAATSVQIRATSSGSSAVTAAPLTATP